MPQYLFQSELAQQIRPWSTAAKDVGSFIDVPAERRNLATDVAGGGGQLGGQIAAAILTGGAASGTMLYAQGVDQMATKTAMDDASQEAKDSAMIMGGAWTYLTEQYGIDKLLNRVPPEIKNRTMRFIADKFVAGGIEAAQEFTEGLMHDITRKVLTNKDAGILDDIGHEMTVAGLSAALVRTALGIKGHRVAAQQQAFFEGLGDASKESKLRERLPEKWKEWIDTASADGPIKNVFIDAKEFTTYFQGQAIDPAVLAKTLGVDDYQSALDRGGNMAIPVGNFAEQIAPTDHLQGLMQDLKLSPMEFSAREAAIAEANKDEAIARIEKEIEAFSANAGNALNSQIARIQDDIALQLSPRYDKQTADTYAQVMRGIAVATARDTQNKAKAEGREASEGEIQRDISAQLAKYDIKINPNPPLPEILAKRPNFKAEIDPFLDMIRAGQGPSESDIFGKSLVDFVRERGGLAPVGELLDVEKVKTPAFKTKLIQDMGKRLDEMAMAAVEAGYFPGVESGQLTETQLVEAILNEIGGGAKTFAGFDESKLNTRETLEGLSRALDVMDLDVAAMDNEAIKAALFPEATFEQVGADATAFKPVDTESAEFKAWFGKSAVVDAEGKPLVVYHGTDKDIEGFDAKKQRTGRWGKGFYFASSPERAKQYGKNVIPVYLRIERSGARDIDADGMIIGSNPSDRIYVVQDPTQIKSATSNTGAFSREDARILYQGGDSRDLVIQHNLSADNLLHAVKMGGIPVPSLAITKAEHPLQGFGEITLLGSKDMADPKGYAGTKVFGADIYSPRYPTVTLRFTPNMQKRGEGMLKDALAATDTRYIDWSEVSKDGVRELERSPALLWQFLKDQGIEPAIVRNEPKPLPATLEPFANDTRSAFDLIRDPAFVEAVLADHKAILAIAYDGDVASAEAEIADIRRNIADRGPGQLIRSYANKIEAYQRALREAGTINKQMTRFAMEQQVREGGMDDAFHQYALDFLQAVNPDEKIRRGSDSQGRPRYIPHTLENVVKILKQELRGGESFNYGVGNVRAKLTPQFKSIEQIRKAKGRLMDKAGFAKVKEEIDADFFALSDQIASFHPVSGEFRFIDSMTSMMYDAASMGVPRALKENGFSEVPAEQQQAVAEFLGKLRTLPTEYFEAKILRDVDLTEFSGAVVPEGELVRAATPREAEDLVAEADAEDREPAEQLAHRRDQVRHALGVARAVGEEQAVGPPLEDLRGGRRSRHDRDLAARHPELPQDVPLDAAVVGDDAEAGRGRRDPAPPESPAALRPGERGPGRHLRDEVPADETRERADALEQTRRVGLDRGDAAVLGAVVSQVAGERARVDPLEADDPVRLQIVVEGRGGAEVRGDRRGLLHDEPVHPRPPRLDVLRVDAVVADEGIGHHHDLPSIGRVGEDLLVARHCGVEDDLAGGLADGAEGLAAEHAAVAQDEDRGRHGRTTAPPTSVSAGAPVSRQPANGVLRLFDLKCRGSTVTACSRSSTVTSPGAPGARLPPGRPSRRTGSRESRETSVARGRRPGRTSRSSSSDTAVSSPTMPNAARSNSPSFSASACGAWSVATQSMVPSASASTSASVSRLVRSGGAIFVFGSYVRTASSVSTRWWGVTSAVTRTPRALPSRTRRTAPAVERWAMCTCAPVSSARRMSRATITSSAAAGAPARPISVETTPSFIAKPRASVVSSAWLITGTPKGSVYSSARR